jgi:manganese transport protein
MKDIGLEDIAIDHQLVDPSKKKTRWGQIFAYFGPAYLISVGYMDPGNWATDIAGGSRYGYALLWVLLMSNLMALLLQSLSARLGIVRGKDLAQASRENYPAAINVALYVLAEIAIAACDLAEVLGMAIGLNLLFHLPILWGVALTIFDTILLLFLQQMGMRRMEMFIISLIAVIGLSFFIEIFLAAPDIGAVVQGFKPALPDSYALYIAIGIIGATVMPHNLYLHSSLIQTRKIDRQDKGSIRRFLKFSVIDSAIALNIAFLVNASILVLAGSVFFAHKFYGVADIRDAHKLLSPLLGSKLAPILFAVALIASGQSSTITGTLAGQVVMEGYLHLRIPMWIRRLLTRLLAILPAFLVVYFYGEDSTGNLLVFSQVILSLQLGFAVIPLIHFVSNKRKMGDFAISFKTKAISWIFAALIVVFNIKLVYDEISGLFQSLEGNWVLKALILTVAASLVLLLAYVTVQPAIVKGFKSRILTSIPHGRPKILGEFQALVYHRIAVTVDFSDMDLKALQYAAAQGGRDATYYLIHIVETPNALLSEKQVWDMEAGADQISLSRYVLMLKNKGYHAEIKIGYGRRTRTIARIVNELDADLVVMGAHGHRGLKDAILGETINAVRHKIHVPLLAVK